jgi:hypothetical protein
VRLNRWLLLITLGALGLRLGLALLVTHPGIGDPNHYYNLGRELAAGRGFVIDYIWQYNDPPDGITHPDDHWMPLTGLLAAGGLALAGGSTFAALLPFILLGTLLVPLVYAAARQLDIGEGGSLFAAAAAAVLPELVLNSLRTDTTIPNAVLITIAVLLFNRGLRTGGLAAFAGSGLAAGLAYLTRSDSILLLAALAGALLLRALWGGLPRQRWAGALLVPLVALLTVAPWLVRNAQTLGYLTARETQYMYFFTDQRDHYAYGQTFTLDTMLERQTPAQIAGKRLFELAAGAKLMYTALDVFLPVAVIGGLALLIAARDRQRLLALSPALLLLLGGWLFYAVLVPYKAQSGSFKKLYLSVVPLLLPLAGYALERAVSDTRLRLGAAAIALSLTAANAVELVRADAAFTALYRDYIAQVVAAARALPDTNGDGEIVLMAQDPFMVNYFGLRAVMLPLAEREGVLEVARRYHVDYLMMPPDRPALDPLYNGAERDPRFVPVVAISGTNAALYGFDLDADSE